MSAEVALHGGPQDGLTVSVVDARQPFRIMRRDPWLPDGQAGPEVSGYYQYTSARDGDGRVVLRWVGWDDDTERNHP